MSQNNNRRVATPIQGATGQPSADSTPQAVVTKRNSVKSDITKGTMIFHVKNLDLAVCLISIGIPLRKDPPYTHIRLLDGTSDWTFHFESCDAQKQLKTSDMIKAFKADMEWIAKNPIHPMTFAMCSVKNRESFLSHMARDVPFVGYKSPGGTAVLYVKEGSQKQANCEAKGMKRVNPGA
jgi:hypothetical protein